MGRLATWGAELNTLADGHERYGSSAQGSIVTSPIRSGARAWRCNPSGAAQAVNSGLSVSGNKTLYFHFGFYATTMPPADALVFSAMAADLTTIMMRLRGTGSGLKVMNSANTQVGSSFALSTAQYYSIEVKVFSHASTGTIDVTVNGVSVVSATGLNTQGSDINGYQFGSGAATTSDYYIDDFAVNDTSGSFQNSWIGDEKIICLRPSGAGDSAQFTRGGSDSGANWSQCDEVTPNDATDYNVSGTLGHIDMFNVDNSGIGASDVINVVHVGLRIANITADGTARIQARAIKTSGGTVAAGTNIGILNSTTWRTNNTSTTAFNPYQLTMYTDPDGSPWTQATLDTMQIGYEITAGGSNGVAVSAVWAMVGYIPNAGGGLVVNPFSGRGGAAALPLAA